MRVHVSCRSNPDGMYATGCSDAIAAVAVYISEPRLFIYLFMVSLRLRIWLELQIFGSGVRRPISCRGDLVKVYFLVRECVFAGFRIVMLFSFLNLISGLFVNCHVV